MKNAFPCQIVPSALYEFQFFEHTILYQLEDHFVNLSRAHWTEKILFKEAVEGTFGIEVGLTEPISDSQAADFVRYLGSSLLKLAGDEADDLTINPLAGSLVRLPFKYLSKVVSSPKKEGMTMLSSGAIDLDTMSTWRGRKSARIAVPLTSLRNIYKTTRPGKKSQRTLLIEEGEPNGVVVLPGKLY